MKGLGNVAVVAQKKPDARVMNKRKAEGEKDSKRKSAKKKDAGAPKRPLSAYLLFMADFRKTHKENFPENKSIAVVAKAGGAKWNSLSDFEKAPYTEKASAKKAEYEKAVEAYKQNGSCVKDESSKSSAEVHDDGEDEASS